MVTDAYENTSEIKWCCQWKKCWAGMCLSQIYKLEKTISKYSRNWWYGHGAPKEEVMLVGACKVDPILCKWFSYQKKNVDLDNTEVRSCEDTEKEQRREAFRANLSTFDDVCQPSELWISQFLLFKAPTLWYFIMAASELIQKGDMLLENGKGWQQECPCWVNSFWLSREGGLQSVDYPTWEYWLSAARCLENSREGRIFF